MLRFLKRFSWVGLLAMSLQLAGAFALLGPINEPYQVPEIGYNLPGDIGAPKNIGEEYRRNTPVMYYAMDQNFLDYFGSNGVVAVDQAFAILNALTNVSMYSAELTEFPLESSRQNYRAGALGLTDVKSTALELMVEQLGLAQPDRYTWTLHSRGRLPGNPPPCPDGMYYFVVKRNFDVLTSALNQPQYSSYVNGTLLTYYISEHCSGDNPLAVAAELRVDPLANMFTAVASYGTVYGEFYSGLTRDDVAGLRYLLRTNNMNFETAGPNTTIAVTNVNVNQLLVTSNLAPLVSAALTNDAAALEALFPGLVVSGTTTVFTNVVTTNQVFYFTNQPLSPAGSPATLSIATIVTTNVTTWYYHSFANVVTNTYYTNGIVRRQNTLVGPCPLGPVNLVCTNVSLTTIATNAITGDYYFLPSNSACGISIVSTQMVNTIIVTNDIITATNAPGTTNVNDQQFSQSTLSYYTNYIYVIHPVPCVDDVAMLRQGVERISFVRRDYDSLIGRFFQPITNAYTLRAVTNSALQPQSVIRRVIQPDFLFTAQDMAPGPSGDLNPWVRRNPSFNSANALAGLAGPGTIEPGNTFTFNKVGQIYYNYRLGEGFLDERTARQLLYWGSFDDTTNAPVVYPNGTSIANLENQVLIQINPTAPVLNGVVALPNGTVGTDYSNVFSGFTVTGGSAPYSWSLSPGSPALPPNLTFNTSNGRISGVPAASTAGQTFDILIRLTDGGLRTVDRSYSITINP